ncbi:MAG: Flp pilus assembly complex ATPase component TadA, partial [Clostridiales bacterium]|nr:Flp pilus assembly complex ATPase component TadA [Clostridiales bacterium]
MIDDSLFRVFLNLNYISQNTYDELSKRHVEEKKAAVQLLNEYGFDFGRIKKALYDNYAIDSFDLNNFDNADNIISEINHETARKYNALPIKRDGGNLYVAMGNPLDNDSVDNLSLITNLNIIPLLAEQPQLKNLINLYYLSDSINFNETQFLSSEGENIKYSSQASFREEVQNSPTVKIIDSLLESAYLLRASDIHIEPYETTLRIRYRVDGSLKEFEVLDIGMHLSLISRLKIMGNLDISEKRLPQEGHFHIFKENGKIDIRVAVIPTIFGEKAVIRIIYSSKAYIDKNNLGFFEGDIAKLNKILQSPHGMVIVAGPTGCGKTTTLYSFLNELNNKE